MAVFSWSADCQEAFEVLKKALITSPVLALPDPSKPYEVITDASGFALGAVLQQDGRPIALASTHYLCSTPITVMVMSLSVQQ